MPLRYLLNDLWAQAQLFPRAGLVTLLLALGMAGMKWGSDVRKWKPKRMLAQWRYGLFLFYLSFMLISAVLYRMHVDPLRNVLSHLWFRKGSVMWNNEIIENILFFIPCSFLFLAAFRPARPWTAALAVSAATTCTLEVSQLVLRVGDFQLSDMLYNIVGGMIGCGLRQAAVMAQKRLWPSGQSAKGDEKCG